MLYIDEMSRFVVDMKREYERSKKFDENQFLRSSINIESMLYIGDMFLVVHDVKKYDESHFLRSPILIVLYIGVYIGETLVF